MNWNAFKQKLYLVKNRDIHHKRTANQTTWQNRNIPVAEKGGTQWIRESEEPGRIWDTQWSAPKLQLTQSDRETRGEEHPQDKAETLFRKEEPPRSHTTAPETKQTDTNHTTPRIEQSGVSPRSSPWSRLEPHAPPLKPRTQDDKAADP